ncbi:hypothetical protein LEN26_019078 [Aphanomyces euteiches]|nr:hypothetical protein LEN26_019078 [Aphanomyces euteiches]KAH9124179.1 hypothetical protein AeMF1_005011 [Aphanomyces euteiches]KAH9186288.1 hypothetical protein AeNC1_011732 [Aphanomyces euteiches]
MKMSMPPIVLPDARKEELLAEIDPMIQPLLDSMIPSGDKWEMNFVRNGVTCFDSLQADPYYRLCLSTCVVRSTLDAAMSALATDTTSALLRAEKEALGDRISNASVVCPLRPRTRKAQHHYIGLKWISYSVTSNQEFDLVFCDAVGMGTHPTTNKRYGYRILRSISIPECPALQSLQRGHVVFNVIKFVETSDPNVLDMQVGINLLCDDVASLSGIFDPYPQTTRLRAYVEAFYRKGTALPSRKATLLPQSLSPFGRSDQKRASHCHLCRKKFHLFRHRYTCSECSNTVCSACTENIKAGAVRRKVCLVCRCTTTVNISDNASPTGGMQQYPPAPFPMYDSEPSPIYDVRTSLWSPRSPRHSDFGGRMSHSDRPSFHAADMAKHKPFNSSRGVGDVKMESNKTMPNLYKYSMNTEDKLIEQIGRSSFQQVSSLQDWNPVDLTARNSLSGQRDSFTCQLRKSLSGFTGLKAS